MTEIAKKDSKKQGASIGFVVVMLMVAGFSAFMTWVWNPTELYAPGLKVEGGSGPSGAMSMAASPMGAAMGGGAPAGGGGERRRGNRRERAEEPVVEVSHPQLMSPAAGAELAFGDTKFEGVAAPGTKVVVFGDGAEMASGVAGDDGKFEFNVPMQAPVPNVFSVGYFAEDGTEIQKVDDLGLKVSGEASAEGVKFALARPVDNGSVAKGDWVIAGTGKPGSRVKLTMDKWVLGEVTVGEDGTWSFPRTVNQVGESRQLIAEEVKGFGQGVVTHTIKVIE